MYINIDIYICVYIVKYKSARNTQNIYYRCCRIKTVKYQRNKINSE